MSDIVVAAGADHDWLAKVLAGDPVACGVLAFARSLPDAEWDSFAKCVEKIRAGVPAVNAMAASRRRDLAPT